MMAAGGGVGAELASEDPLLDGWIADAEHARGLTRVQHGRILHSDHSVPSAPSFGRDESRAAGVTEVFRVE